jgi:CheY-like chemotaxis protein
MNRQAADAARSSGAAAATRTGRRILVVDDNVDAARLMADALEVEGHQTQVAFDGLRALELAAAFRPDAALLDLGLPLMDGYELAEQLVVRAEERPPVLVAVTGYGQTSDQERTRKAGFHAHIVKPVDVPELMTILDRLFAAD